MLSTRSGLLWCSRALPLPLLLLPDLAGAGRSRAMYYCRRGLCAAGMYCSCRCWMQVPAQRIGSIAEAFAGTTQVVGPGSTCWGWYVGLSSWAC